MKWKDVNDELPKGEKKRYLAYCSLPVSEGRYWSGIVSVIFSPQIGWMRCDGQKQCIEVHFYSDYPENLPKIK